MPEADTLVSPFDSAGTQASRVTFVCGGAAMKVAQLVKDKMARYGAKLLACDIEDIVMRDGFMWKRQTGDSKLSYGEAATLIQSKFSDEAGETITYQSPGNPASYGANFVEVEVDVETGRAKVLEVLAVYDIGKVINSGFVVGQVQGAVQMGIGMALSEEEVRAIMLARLNTLLVGATGIQPEIAVMYKDMLNAGVHPVIPERGSVGEADITCLSHVGLAMLGEGEAFYNGDRIASAEALKRAGLEPVVLGPKDGLAIVSSNALSAGVGALVLNDIKELLDISDVIYALSLEGLNGNVSPLDVRTHRIRPYPGQAYSAERITEYLEGSYIWEADWKKPVQDPLSFRGSAHVHGAVRDAVAYVEGLLVVQLNSSDDNPCIIMDDKNIISCSNFEVTNWSLGFEMLGLALSQLSKVSCHRMIKLGNPAFTKLSRFLSPADNVLAFATVQKTYTSLDTYDSIRGTVPFYDKDRNLSVGINKAYENLRSGKLLRDVNEAMRKNG
ncbi:MAG: aromatic amino acid lyase [Clostridia bacterium]